MVVLSNFFKNVNHCFNFQAFNKLDEIQIRLTTTDLPPTSSLLAKLHSDIAHSLDEATEAATIRGNELLGKVGPNSQGADVWMFLI